MTATVDIHAQACELAHTARQGLDMTDHEDRATFRTNLTQLTRDMNVTLIRAMARAVGVPVKGNCSRAAAVRALADGF